MEDIGYSLITIAKFESIWLELHKYTYETHAF